MSMKVEPSPKPMMKVPTELQAHAAVENARVLYRRTMASWVSDLLVMRRDGTAEPAWTAQDSRRAA